MGLEEILFLAFCVGVGVYLFGGGGSAPPKVRKKRRSRKRPGGKPAGEGPPSQAAPGGLDMLSRIEVGQDEQIEGRITETLSRELPDPAMFTQGQNPEQTLEMAGQKYMDKPHDPANISVLAYSLFALRRVDEALELYETGLQIKADDPTMMLYQGSCYYLKGQARMARKIWERVIEVAPAGKMAAKAKARLEQLDRQEGRDEGPPGMNQTDGA